MAYSGQGIQFFCSHCNTILREAAPLDGASISEECPACGSQLSETLQVKKQAAPSLPQVPFKTAYEINAMLALGIEAIDPFLALRLGDRLCVIGNHANLLVARLCVRALMPARQGGLGSQSVMFVDAGNSSDIYQCVSFARQFGLDIRQVLRSIVVSRAFTIHQLAGVIAYELPNAIRRFNSKLVVISDLLKMFVEDPQVSRKEAEYLIGEIMDSIVKIDNILLVLSLHGESPYNNRILQSFGKRIEIEKQTIRLHNGRRSQQIFMPKKGLRIVG